MTKKLSITQKHRLFLISYFIFSIVAICAIAYGATFYLTSHYQKQIMASLSPNSDDILSTTRIGLRQITTIIPKENRILLQADLRENLGDQPKNNWLTKLETLLPATELQVIHYQEKESDSNKNKTVLIQQNEIFSLFINPADNDTDYTSRIVGVVDKNTDMTVQNQMAIDPSDKKSLYQLRYVINTELKKQGKQYKTRAFLNSTTFLGSTILRNGDNFTLELPSEYAQDGQKTTITTKNLIPFMKDVALTDNQKKEKDQIKQHIVNEVNQVKQIALTLDDGPGPYSEEVMTIFEDYDAGASYFVEGRHVEDYPNSVRRMARDGFTIGNHTWDHKELNTLTVDEVKGELIATQEFIQQVTNGYTPIYVRPPKGYRDQNILNDIHSLGLKQAVWTHSTYDWKVLDSSKICDDVISHAKPNDVVLMHEVHQTTVKALPQIIQKLQDQGYDLCTLDEMNTIPSEVTDSVK